MWPIIKFYLKLYVTFEKLQRGYRTVGCICNVDIMLLVPLWVQIPQLRGRLRVARVRVMLRAVGSGR